MSTRGWSSVSRPDSIRRQRCWGVSVNLWRFVMRAMLVSGGRWIRPGPVISPCPVTRLEANSFSCHRLWVWQPLACLPSRTSPWSAWRIRSPPICRACWTPRSLNIDSLGGNTVYGFWLFLREFDFIFALMKNQLPAQRIQKLMSLLSNLWNIVISLIAGDLLL